MPAKPEIERMLPLSSSVYCILLSLAGGDRHGYAIKQHVAELTRDEVSLGAGTLYGALARLLDAGLIAERDRPARAEGDDERRRYYRLSAFGRQVLTAEVARLRALSALAGRVGFARPARVISPA